MVRDQLARVRLLSSRFVELQGLRVAFAGATIALVFGSYLIATEPTHTGGMIAMGISFVLMIPTQWWAHRYYAVNFGRQVRKPTNLIPTMLFFLVYFIVASYLNRRFEAIPAGAPTAATVALASVWIALRDWPWRWYYLVPAVAVGTALGANVVGAEVIDRGMTLTVTFLTCGLSMMSVGLLDHRLLVNLMAEVRGRQVLRESRAHPEA